MHRDVTQKGGEIRRKVEAFHSNIPVHFCIQGKGEDLPAPGFPHPLQSR